MRNTSEVARAGSLVLAALILGSSAEAAATFVVPASGGDDTQALQAAFDAAAAAGPGSTVRLEAGSYCVTAPVVVRGFDGSWLGAGRDVTVVETCADPFPVPMLITADPFHSGDPQLSVREPFVFLEVEGGPPTALHMSDLTLQLNGTTQPYYRHGNEHVITIFQNAIRIIGKRPTVPDGVSSAASLRMEHCAIRGEAAGLLFGVSRPINTIQGIVFQDGQDYFSSFPGDVSTRRADALRIQMTMESSHMERVGIAFGSPGVARGSNLTIGGAASRGNTFAVVGEALRFGDLSGSRLEYSHNEGDFGSGPRIAQGIQALLGFEDGPQPVPLPERSELVITHNRFTLKPYLAFTNGVEILDLPIAFFGKEARTLDALIAWNQFDSEAAVFAAVDGWLIADCLVQYNIIRGQYLAGIALGYDHPPGFPVFPGSGCTLQGNNVQKASAGAAPVFLGPFSSDNLVVGGGEKNVLDLGTDNTVTGRSNMGGEGPGPALREALERKRELFEGQ